MPSIPGTPPEHWLRAASSGPPPHWVEKVRHAAPHLLQPQDRLPVRQNPPAPPNLRKADAPRQNREVRFEQSRAPEQEPEPSYSDGMGTAAQAPRFQPGAGRPVPRHAIYRRAESRDAEARQTAPQKAERPVRTPTLNYKIQESPKPQAGAGADLKASGDGRARPGVGVRLQPPQTPGARGFSVARYSSPHISPVSRDVIWPDRQWWADIADSPSYPNETGRQRAREDEQKFTATADAPNGVEQEGLPAASEGLPWPELLADETGSERDRLGTMRIAHEMARRRAAEAEQTGR
jgi:hypothetical protein